MRCHVICLSLAAQTPSYRAVQLGLGGRKGSLYKASCALTVGLIWSVGSLLCGSKISFDFVLFDLIIFQDFSPSVCDLFVKSNQHTWLGDLCLTPKWFFLHLPLHLSHAWQPHSKRKKVKKKPQTPHSCRVNATVPIILIICISYRLTNKAASW